MTITIASRHLHRTVLLAVALVLATLALGAADARAGVVQRENNLSAGGYRTLATLWNASAKARFR